MTISIFFLLSLIISISSVSLDDIDRCRGRLDFKIHQYYNSQLPKKTPDYIIDYFTNESEELKQILAWGLPVNNDNSDFENKFLLYSCILHLNDLHNFKNNGKEKFDTLKSIFEYYSQLKYTTNAESKQEAAFKNKILVLNKKADTVYEMENALLLLMNFIAKVNGGKLYYLNKIGAVIEFVKNEEAKKNKDYIPTLPTDEKFYTNCRKQNFKNCFSTSTSNFLKFGK